MYNLPFLIVLMIALAHIPDPGEGHGVDLGGCFGEARGLHPALNAGAGRRYGAPVPGQGYGSNYGGGSPLGFNHGVAGVRRRRLRRPLQSFNPNEVAFPHGFPPPVSGPVIGNGIPLVDPDYPGHGPSFTPDGYPVPPQISGIPQNFYPPAQPDILPPPNQVIGGGHSPPYGHSISSGYFGQNEKISAPPPHSLVVSGTGVATANEYQVGNTIITGDGVVLATANGDLLPPTVGRQRSYRSKTRNGLVTSDEVVITRGGKLSSSSRSYSNRIYL